MHIHDKFVVVDFNAANPTVFTGSSNLAAGGEQANGDSLAMIEDAAIANMFAIEAVAMFDHFHFRKVMQTVTEKQPPLTLWYPGKPNAPNPWWKAYYDPKQIQMRDRYLFSGLPLPAGLTATKNVDWSAIDAAAAAPKKPAAKAGAQKAPATGAKETAGKAPSAKKSSAKKSSSKKSAAKKGTAKKAAKKTVKKTAKKSAGKKPGKTAAKKAPAKTTSSKKTAAKKKKTAAPKKAAAKKSATRKSAKGRKRRT
jgi:hypothetical protein